MPRKSKLGPCQAAGGGGPNRRTASCIACGGAIRSQTPGSTPAGARCQSPAPGRLSPTPRGFTAVRPAARAATGRRVLRAELHGGAAGKATAGGAREAGGPGMLLPASAHIMTPGGGAAAACASARVAAKAWRNAARQTPRCRCLSRRVTCAHDTSTAHPPPSGSGMRLGRWSRRPPSTPASSGGGRRHGPRMSEPHRVLVTAPASISAATPAPAVAYGSAAAAARSWQP